MIFGLKRGYGVIIDFHLLDDSVPVILNNDIGFGGHSTKDVLALFRLEIEGHRSLAPVHRFEVWVDGRDLGMHGRSTSRVSQLRVLDMDDIGPHIGEHAGGPGAVLKDGGV